MAVLRWALGGPFASWFNPGPFPADAHDLSLSVHLLLPSLQVIGGAGLDVDFTLESPQGVLLVSESRKADGVHT
jgi:hypothetical protein